MKFRTTLLAALLLALAGAYVYYFEYKKAQEREGREEKEKKVFNIDWEKVSGLNVQNPQGVFAFQKTEEKKAGSSVEAGAGGGWQIEQPVKTEADSATLESLVSTLENLKVERVVTDAPENLGFFGLQEPALKVGVVLREGDNPASLLVGEMSPVGQNSYGMREGENKVLLLSANLETPFNKSLTELREKKLFSFQREDVERIRVFRGGDRLIELVREGDAWRIRHPIRARAAEDEVNELLNKLTGLRAMSFHEEEPRDLKPYGLQEPAWKVEVVLGPEHAQASLLLGDTHGDERGSEQVFAKRGERPMVVSLGNDLLRTLEQNPEAFREKRVLPFRNWEAGKIELAWADQEATLEKTEENQWRITRPFQARAASGRVTSFLAALSRLEAEEFLRGPFTDLDRVPYGLDRPVLKVTLWKETEKEGGEGEEGASKIGTVLLGQPVGGGERCYASVEGDEFVYSVRPDFLRNEAPADAEALREKKLLSFYRYQVDAVEWEGPKGTVVLRKKNGNWEVKKPKSGQAEGKDVDSLLEVLTDLEVDRYVGTTPVDLAPYGLASPEYRIVLGQEEEKGKQKTMGTLLLAGVGPEGDDEHFYATVAGDGWIGLVHKDRKAEVLARLAPFDKEP